LLLLAEPLGQIGRGPSQGALSLYFLRIEDRGLMNFKHVLLAALVGVAGAAQAQDKPYKVIDGYKVDAETMKGFRAWRAAACDRCHGANQEGLVGPSLLVSLKTLSKDDFIVTVKNGRLDKGMQSFGNSPVVMDNINQLYAYLKGRADGEITRAKVEELK
jgi:mono/diheme cytochrome c family protein